MFEYRHETTAGDLGWHQKYSQQKLRIAITGGTGLVGSELAAFLTTGGHEVIELGRRDSGSGNKWVKWDVESGVADPSALEGIDAVVHLAGENIADGRWTDKRKDAIVKSRVDGTRNLVASLTGLAKPPKTFVCASAIGIYGDSGDAVMTEDSPAAEDFLAGVCRNWESASRPAETAGIRVVNLRIGVVLTPEGGALKKTLLPFKLGAGGRLGSGRQYMSWIAIDDLVGAILHCIATEDLSGPVNATAPGPVTNAVYTKSLASILKRPAIAPAPAFVLRLALGEMADALLLSSTRVVPKKLEDSGFEFRYPQIDHALSHLLGA